MRLRFLLLVGFMALPLPSASFAQVLLPDEPSSQTDLQPNLGLTPRQQGTPPTSSTLVPPPTSEATKGEALDTVDMKTLQSVDIGVLRSGMPQEFKNLTDEDVKKLIAMQSNIDKADIVKKYVKTDPKTGQNFIDFELMRRDKLTAQAKKAFVPGGKVTTTKALTAQDKLVASQLAKGKLMPKSGPLPSTRRPKFLQKPPIIAPSFDLPPYENPLLKFSVSVSVPKDYVWGNADIQKIADTLGYAADAVPMNCQLRLDTSLVTDDGSNMYNATIMGGASQKLSYNGNLQAVKTRPYAVCMKPTTALPSNGGVLFAYGDKYAVLFPEATCQLAASTKQTQDRAPSSVVMQYTGDSKITCTAVK